MTGPVMIEHQTRRTTCTGCPQPHKESCDGIRNFHIATASAVKELWDTGMPLSPSCTANGLLKLCAMKDTLVSIVFSLAHLQLSLSTSCASRECWWWQTRCLLLHCCRAS